jgi:hypothetical protein
MAAAVGLARLAPGRGVAQGTAVWWVGARAACAPTAPSSSTSCWAVPHPFHYNVEMALLGIRACPRLLIRKQALFVRLPLFL